MKNPEPWDRFCLQFDELLPSCLPFHSQLVQNLIAHDWGADCPNMLFYGAVGFPIPLLLDHMLRAKYGSFTRTACQIASSLDYYETQYFFEFDFHHPNFAKHSNECIELIKQIIQTSCIHRDRHIVVLKNVDGVAHTAKQMFRVLLERYSKQALFICTTNIISALEPPLKSRFMLVRVPLAGEEEVKQIVLRMGYSYPTIIRMNRNLYKTLLIIDLLQKDAEVANTEHVCRFHYPPFGDLPATVTLETVRQYANKISQTNIPLRNIVMDLLDIQKTDQSRYDLIEIACNAEHMLACTTGGRQILYIEMILCAAFFGKNKSPVKQ